MFTFLRPVGKQPRTVDVLSTLRQVEERLVINTSNGNFFREMQKYEFDSSFISRFNQGDAIYPADSPFASFIRDNHINSRLARYDRKTGAVVFCGDKWPEVVGEYGYLIEDDKGHMHRVTDLFGLGARTRLNQSDYALWTGYWSILDIFRNAGIPTLDNDDRVPFRESYLHSYQAHNYPQQTFDGFSKEEIETELVNRAARFYTLPDWLAKLITEWVDEYPDNFYRVKFQGSMVVIDRRASVKSVAYHAHKENHPLLKRLEAMNLI